MDIQKLYELYKNFPEISTDSRCVKEKSIFFALKGENYDGNEFAESALNNKAEYAVIEKKYTNDNERYILVEDTLGTLQELANYHRRNCGFEILAITGSNGKTTTKELIYKILSKDHKVYATKGNLNNHIGVPLTILSMTADTEIGIVEMGANHYNEIKQLCEIAEPDFGLITNIGKAHLEGFGSIEGVKKAKEELFSYLIKNNGLIIGNLNDANVKDIIPENYKDIIPYGNETGRCWAKYVSADPYLRFILYMDDYTHGIEINTKMFGRYNIENAVAAATFALIKGIDKDTIKQALEEYIPENNRSQILKTRNNKIFLDAYNANPTSMKAAIENFMETSERNKYFILGEMLEVGNNSETEHRNILAMLKEWDLLNVLCVGSAFRNAAEKYGYMFFNNIDELTEMLEKEKIKNASIFIKGSRANKMERAVQFL